jgi:N-acetylmuramoyl-L-alanine amidase
LTPAAGDLIIKVKVAKDMPVDKITSAYHQPDRSSPQRPDDAPPPLKGKKICIDAGHGGYDAGALGPGGANEKDVNLDIALKTKAELEKCGAEVLLTRTDDTFVSLQDRTDFANKEKCDIFISAHENSAAKKKRIAHGTETFWHTKGDDNDKKLATELQTNIVSAIGLTDRGVKQANFAVLRESEMPAALIETAFISNPEEEKLLTDPVFQQKVAMAVTKGVLGYFGCVIPSSF